MRRFVDGNDPCPQGQRGTCTLYLATSAPLMGNTASLRITRLLDSNICSLCVGDSGQCESVVRPTINGSTHCLPSMPLSHARSCLSTTAVDARDATEQHRHVLPGEKLRGIAALPRMRTFPRRPCQRQPSVRRFVRFPHLHVDIDWMAKLPMQPSICPFETFPIQPCRRDPWWKGMLGKPSTRLAHNRYLSPSIDSNLPFHTYLRASLSSTGSVPSLFLFR